MKITKEKAIPWTKDITSCSVGFQFHKEKLDVRNSQTRDGEDKQQEAIALNTTLNRKSSTPNDRSPDKM